MKIKNPSPLFVAALILAGTLSAHSPSGTAVHQSHGSPEFVFASRTYQLFDDTTQDEITVTWESDKACPNPKLMQSYKVTITRSNKDTALYSLWTLGLQEADSATVIHIPSANQLQIAESDTSLLRAVTTREVVAPAGWRVMDPANPGLRIVDESRIWLMEFTGTSFTFTVERYNLGGMTVWSSKVFNCPSPGDGHDNTPPI